ncbi:NAD(P)H-dependent oxidoreductase [Veronia pacifica]|uniref:NAD(P)H dehydrogenase n=1 Tax=Veronia pacifica TaxID=1080227 RepID=A0A1C3EBM5_9GAMM|nr:NAD(P)H-dependent oxidoreductase [Veronia pacifica]ODA30642.1 NAD(P)H dehydrogenase [Veronia pacifica]
MKKVLVINGNPKSDSLCKSMADQYATVAAKHHKVEQIHVGDLDFQMNLSAGYDKNTEMEPDLANFQKMIMWAEHVVIVSPVWWGTVPAKLKGLIDRTFLPNFAFKYTKGKAIPEKLLKGRTSELIITLDTPPFWYKFVKGNAVYKQLKKCTLDFTGIKNRTSTYFGPVINSKPESREVWLGKVSKLASNLK